VESIAEEYVKVRSRGKSDMPLNVGSQATASNCANVFPFTLLFLEERAGEAWETSK
jgi:hypothetical protein